MAEIEKKEISVVKQSATKAVATAMAMNIANQDDMERATDILSNIKNLGKTIKQRKEEITRPLMDSLESVRELFKPIEQSHAEAERIIKAKMGDYLDEQQRIRDEEAAKIAKKLENEQIKPATAIRKMEALPEVQKSVHGNTGSISQRIMKKARIVDANLIPRAYLVPDMSRINFDATHGVQIAGVEVYEEKVISAR